MVLSSSKRMAWEAEWNLSSLRQNYTSTFQAQDQCPIMAGAQYAYSMTPERKEDSDVRDRESFH